MSLTGRDWRNTPPLHCNMRVRTSDDPKKKSIAIGSPIARARYAPRDAAPRATHRDDRSRSPHVHRIFIHPHPARHASTTTTMSAVSATSTHLSQRRALSTRIAARRASTRTAVRANVKTTCAREGPVVIGLAADSGCGKSTFMRRMTSLFGGKATPPEGGNPDSNTLISDTTTVLCLDDYHLNDRQGRKESGLTALNLKEQNFGRCDDA